VKPLALNIDIPIRHPVDSAAHVKVIRGLSKALRSGDFFIAINSRRISAAEKTRRQLTVHKGGSV
jgi:hypothetical protein